MGSAENFECIEGFWSHLSFFYCWHPCKGALLSYSFNYIIFHTQYIGFYNGLNKPCSPLSAFPPWGPLKPLDPLLWRCRWTNDFCCHLFIWKVALHGVQMVNPIFSKNLHLVVDQDQVEPLLETKIAINKLWASCWAILTFVRMVQGAQMVKRVTADPRVCGSNPAKVHDWELAKIQSYD